MGVYQNTHLVPKDDEMVTHSSLQELMDELIARDDRFHLVIDLDTYYGFNRKKKLLNVVHAIFKRDKERYKGKCRVYCVLGGCAEPHKQVTHLERALKKEGKTLDSDTRTQAYQTGKLQKHHQDKVDKYNRKAINRWFILLREYLPKMFPGQAVLMQSTFETDHQAERMYKEGICNMVMGDDYDYCLNCPNIYRMDDDLRNVGVYGPEHVQRLLEKYAKLKSFPDQDTMHFAWYLRRTDHSDGLNLNLSTTKDKNRYVKIIKAVNDAQTKASKEIVAEKNLKPYELQQHRTGRWVMENAACYSFLDAQGNPATPSTPIRELIPVLCSKDKSGKEALNKVYFQGKTIEELMCRSYVKPLEPPSQYDLTFCYASARTGLPFEKLSEKEERAIESMDLMLEISGSTQAATSRESRTEPKVSKTLERLVEQVCLKTNETLDTHPSVVAAAKKVFPGNASAADNIANCLRGHRSSAMNFFWRFAGTNTPVPDKAKINRAVERLHPDTNKVEKTYTSIAEAARDMKMKNAGEIGSVLNGKRRIAAGKFWRLEGSNEICPARFKPVTKIDLKTGNAIVTYDTITEAAAKEKLDGSTITKVCKNKLKQHGGFGWRYEAPEEFANRLAAKHGPVQADVQKHTTFPDTSSKHGPVQDDVAKLGSSRVSDAADSHASQVTSVATKQSFPSSSSQPSNHLTNLRTNNTRSRRPSVMVQAGSKPGPARVSDAGTKPGSARDDIATVVSEKVSNKRSPLKQVTNSPPRKRRKKSKESEIELLESQEAIKSSNPSRSKKSNASGKESQLLESEEETDFEEEEILESEEEEMDALLGPEEEDENHKLPPRVSFESKRPRRSAAKNASYIDNNPILDRYLEALEEEHDE